VEAHPTRGQRGVRQTRHPKTGAWSAPKKLTYARQVRIVDGDDGRTYLLERGLYSSLLSVMCGDMKFQAETISQSDPRFAALWAMVSEYPITNAMPIA
jgi:hypothetical protein